MNPNALIPMLLRRLRHGRFEAFEVADVVITTPASRLFPIQAEARTIIIPYEPRRFDIPARD